MKLGTYALLFSTVGLIAVVTHAPSGTSQTCLLAGVMCAVGHEIVKAIKS